MLRQRQWKEIKGLNRPREIVGLFKLSKPGVEFFLEEWNLALPQGTIAVNPWQVAAGSKLEPRESVDTIDCLIGDFLGYLHMRYEDRKRKKDGNDKYTKLRFKLKTVSAGWHEIDHWGDYVRAIERIESKDADRLVLS